MLAHDIEPYHLRGAYAPVGDERTFTNLEVVGQIPTELRGTFVRNGPNPRGASPAWFAGEGMLHGVRIEDGHALWYRNRWMRPRGPNTSVVHHAGRLFASVEVALPLEVDGALETVGPHDFGGRLSRPFSAHPKTRHDTGELVFLSYTREPPFVVHYRVDRGGHIVDERPISVPAPTYMHDMAITDRYSVFWDLPVLVGDWRSPEPLRWSDDYRARMGLLPRGGRDEDVLWFDVEPCAISHAMNAYEDGELVVLDVVRGPRPTAAHALYRYTFDVRRGTVDEREIDPRFIDFPRVVPTREGRPYRYGYGVELGEWRGGGWHSAVPRKIEMESGTSVAHDFGPRRMAGECVLVPRTGATAEDDAWAILFVHDVDGGPSELVILDASRFDEAPVAAVRLPCRVPVGIHGAWVSDPAA
jgi:carotenoid cleavage dioxygenase-like enzyme